MNRRIALSLAAVAVVALAVAGGGLWWLRAKPEVAPPPEKSELPRPSGDQRDGPWHKVVLATDEQVDGEWADTLQYPIELDVASDGRVFFVEWWGAVKLWDPATGRHRVVARLDVYQDLESRTEEGLLGLALDPDFDENGWIYIHYADPVVDVDANGDKSGILRLSRFDFDGEQLLLDTERVLLETRMDRNMCCHAAGGIGFDRDGLLYVGIGDNTPPQAGAGYACLDERPGNRLFDSQRTAGNTNDLRGKILRIRPEPEGGYSIPEGNLFPPGTPQTRPEIYIMGTRNPWRFGFDDRKGFLYWGDPGPDAGITDVRKQIRELGRELLRGRRGPPGHDEVNRARVAGNFGWPYFLGPNVPYSDWDYEKNEAGELFEPDHVVNDSPNNTGLRELPPPQPSIIHYPYAPSEEFPEAGGDEGRVAGAGPVYYWDPDLVSDCKLPESMDHVLFTFDWMRNWIMAVHLDENEEIERLERFAPGLTFMSPIDVEIGRDGCLYVLEWGSYWGADNLDSQLVRVEYRAEAAGTGG